MANGQQLAQEYVVAFKIWKETQSDESYTQIIHRGKLNRGEISKAIGCGRSALNQNPELKWLLEELEDNLRVRGVLPPLKKKAKSELDTNRPKLFKPSWSGAVDLDYVADLERQIIELKEANAKLEKESSRFTELSEVLVELGMIPR